MFSVTTTWRTEKYRKVNPEIQTSASVTALVRDVSITEINCYSSGWGFWLSSCYCHHERPPRMWRKRKASYGCRVFLLNKIALAEYFSALTSPHIECIEKVKGSVIAFGKLCALQYKLNINVNIYRKRMVGKASCLCAKICYLTQVYFKCNMDGDWGRN